jgi:shikimate kinase
VLVARLAGESDRPLLGTTDPQARIRDLLAARATAYASLPYHLDTSNLAPDEVTEAILALWHTQTQFM